MICFYFDEHMPRPVAKGLVERGYEVVMAIDVDMAGKDDDTEHLSFSTEEEDMVMVTFDRPFAGRTMSRTDHSGLVCLSESLRHDIGGMIQQLAAFADTYAKEDVAGRVFWLKRP